MAGTGSHKPYLFNADNVARFAPGHWHSGGSVIDPSYEALDRIARGARVNEAAARPGAAATPEPPLLGAPPAGLGPHAPDARTAERLRGRAQAWSTLNMRGQRARSTGKRRALSTCGTR